jgi:RNA polymerase sigma-70 factor (ECF subfamily)
MSQAEYVTQVQRCLARVAAGEPTAFDDLIRLSQDRLRLIARAGLNHFPRLRRYVESDDVLNDLLSGLEADLRAVRPGSAREFLGLAALKVRRRLIDAARKMFGRYGPGANLATPPAGTDRGPLEPAGDGQDDPARLAEFAELQDLVDTLPGEEREVIDLHYYQDLSLPEVADVLGVSVSTIKRKLSLAKVRLAQLLGKDADLGIPNHP